MDTTEQMTDWLTSEGVDAVANKDDPLRFVAASRRVEASRGVLDSSDYEQSYGDA